MSYSWAYSITWIIFKIQKVRPASDRLMGVQIPLGSFLAHLILGSYLWTNCPPVKMLTETGKKRVVLAGNTKDEDLRFSSFPKLFKNHFL